MTIQTFRSLTRRAAVAAAACALLAAGPAQAALATIDFESFGVPVFNSQNFNAGGQEAGFDMATSGSGDFLLANLGALTVAPLVNTYLSHTQGTIGTLTITELDPTTPFSLLSIDLGNGGNSASTLNVTGLLGGSTVATDSFVVNPLVNATFGPGNLAGIAIDELRLEFNQPTIQSALLADNIRFETGPAAVPVPAPLALMVAGLVGIAGTRRRRSLAA